MPTFIEKTQRIREEGKIHWFLLIRLRVLLVLSFTTGGIFAYNILYGALDQGIAVILAFLGFGLGFALFSRMNVIDWDAAGKKIIFAGMDITAIGIFILYVGFEIAIHTSFKDLFPASTVAFILALAFGMLCGRTAALALKINRAYERTKDS